MLPTVFEPISFSGSRKSTIGSRAVRANNPEIDMPMPGQIDAAEELAVRRDDIEVDGGAQIDHHDGSAIFAKTRDAVHQPVRAHFARIVVADRDAEIRQVVDEHAACD